MTVDWVPLGLFKYQPQHLRIRSSARAVWPIEKCAWISKDEMKGEMFSGSSGATAPIGVQFLSRLVDTVSAFESLLVTLKRTAMLFASCGYRVVAVALSLNAP